MPLANSDRPGLPLKEGEPAIKPRPDADGVPQPVLEVAPPLFASKTLKSGLDSHFLVRFRGKICVSRITGHERTTGIEPLVGEGVHQVHMQEGGIGALNRTRNGQYTPINPPRSQ